MNWKQIVFLWIGTLAIISICIYPPYLYSETRNLKGHYFIWSPPIEENKTFQGLDAIKNLTVHTKYYEFSIDSTALTIEVGVILLITLGLIISFSERKKNDYLKKQIEKLQKEIDVLKKI